MDEATRAVAEAFGCDDDTAYVVASSLDSALEAALDAAFILYHPFFGIHEDAGLLSPHEATQRVLSDIADAAPDYPSWAIVGDMDEGDEKATYELNGCVDVVVDNIIAAVDQLGRASVLGDIEDLVREGQGVLRTLVSLGGHLDADALN